MQNLFAILGLSPSFVLNEKALETAYFTAQRACHPDRFVGRSEAERIAAVSRSQLVNDAYETLKNPLTRAEHLLEMQGLTALDDTAKAPPALLMEMMELREQVADAGSDGATLARVVEDVKKRAASTTRALEEAFAAQEYLRAVEETMRLHYLGKAMEEAHMYIYRLKAAHG